ncbi:hypothetical protein DFP72DRAFT_905791 [Ephemerocybe angulata]|uniref:Uncharacterized protein n=1 Tax=Ephemerocybe angulata TaxID=980116 RepID=A0A8H6HSJ1_9AGAR|nr:hypothetical protein DFP72DRAFT_905791 [Tulosesus angulatus]
MSSTPPIPNPKPSSTVTKKNAPASIAELSALVRRRLWTDDKELGHWLDKASAYRKKGEESLKKAEEFQKEGLRAKEMEQKEKAFVHLSKAAILMVEKVPKHPGMSEVPPGLYHTLVNNGGELIGTIADLKKELREEHQRWVKRQSELEQKRKEDDERNAVHLSRLSQALSPDDNEDAEPVAISVEPPAAEEDSEKLQAIRLELAEISRPSSPVLPEGPITSHALLRNTRVQEAEDFPQEGHLAPPSYEDVMSDIAYEGGATTPRSDNGSEYGFEVVQPDHSAGALTPQYEPSVDFPSDVYEKKDVKRHESRSSSRRSSISKSRKASPSPVRAAATVESQDICDLDKALEDVYMRLAHLRKMGTLLPPSTRKRLEELKRFLL